MKTILLLTSTLFILTNCTKCPTTSQIEKWKSKGCITFSTITSINFRIDTVNKLIYIKDSSYNKSLDSLVDNLPLKDSLNGKPVNVETKKLIKNKVKKAINDFVKKQEPKICGFTKTVIGKNYSMDLTFDGTNLTSIIKYKQTNLTVNSDSIWKYWRDIIAIIAVSLIIGAIIMFIIKK